MKLWITLIICITVIIVSMAGCCIARYAMVRTCAEKGYTLDEGGVKVRFR